MGLIDIVSAQTILGPHHATLSECVHNAWARWQRDVQPAAPTFFPRVRADIVNNLIVDEARTRFGPVPGVMLIECPGQLLVSILDSSLVQRLLIRFKKLDDGLMSVNYPTQRALRFDAQGTLPDVPDVPRLTVGYRLDALEVAIRDVFVVLRERASNVWSYPLANPAAAQMPMPHIVPAPVTGPGNTATPVKRVRAKRPAVGEGEGSGGTGTGE